MTKLIFQQQTFFHFQSNPNILATALSLILPLCFHLAIPFCAPAQVENEEIFGSVSQEEIRIQETFIEGNREKLLGNWEKAASKFQEVLQKNPKNAAAAYELARVYEHLKDLEKAIANAKTATEVEPANAWFKIYLANLYQQTQKDEQAALIYQQLAKSDPYNDEYYLKWAYSLVKAGKPEKAIEVYNQLEKRVGVNEELARHKHTLYLSIGDYKKAARELENLIARFPRKTAYRHLLATFYEQSGDRTKAGEVYREILRLDPEDARAKIALAGEAKNNDDIRFLQSLKPIFENRSVSIDTKIKEIIPYIEKLAETQDKNLGTALTGLATVLENVHPEEAKTYSTLGDVLFYTGQTDKALAQYEKCLQLNPNVWPVWEQVLHIYTEKKDYDRLIEVSEKALDIFPNQASAYYYNGLGYNGKEQYRQALESLQQALIMSSKNPRLRYDVLNQTGLAYFHLRQYPQSDNAFEEALKINATAPPALIHYSHCLATRNEHLEKARSLATTLLRQYPGVPAHEAAMAFVLYKMKDYKSAKDLLHAALNHGGQEDPLILEYYGDVSFQTGNVEEAVHYWQKALQHGGNSSLLRKKIAEKKLFE